MTAQSRLPGTLPAPAVARKQHKEAVRAERDAQHTVDQLRDAMKDARAALKKATAIRQRTED
ncbi:MAG TPA: hypothetical protein VHP55_10860, partial [Usitatibacter sp.]|nr:hypothetical protein [Usitatibacter sp.]